ncbi:hypothetical protein AZE42_14208 [Rhizopogon vesiculosus]|uniref:Uncharacterized protein n=1 Tax=Rhizopogon vesiculosus TaxID=180088 RepID=A0A1J8QBB2_9AGAM|nr:hypothetical protein AZE42_14208 [Rhizopogon vesiculosus]
MLAQNTNAGSSWIWYRPPIHIATWRHASPAPVNAALGCIINYLNHRTRHYKQPCSV